MYAEDRIWNNRIWDSCLRRLLLLIPPGWLRPWTRCDMPCGNPSGTAHSTPKSPRKSLTKIALDREKSSVESATLCLHFLIKKFTRWLSLGIAVVRLLVFRSIPLRGKGGPLGWTAAPCLLHHRRVVRASKDAPTFSPRKRRISNNSFTRQVRSSWRADFRYALVARTPRRLGVHFRPIPIDHDFPTLQ